MSDCRRGFNKAMIMSHMALNSTQGQRVFASCGLKFAQVCFGEVPANKRGAFSDDSALQIKKTTSIFKQIRI